MNDELRNFENKELIEFMGYEVNVKQFRYMMDFFEINRCVARDHNTTRTVFDTHVVENMISEN